MPRASRSNSSAALMALLIIALACSLAVRGASAQAVGASAGEGGGPGFKAGGGDDGHRSHSGKKTHGVSTTAPLPSRCLVKATPAAASYRVELAPVLEYDELMTAAPDAACWDVYSRNDTCTPSNGALACGMGDPTALRVQVANKCATAASASRPLNVTINGVDGDLLGSTAKLIVGGGGGKGSKGSSSSSNAAAVLHVTLPSLKTHTLKRRVCVQFTDRCPTLRDLCGSGKATCQVELRGRAPSAAAKRTGCAQAGATFSVSSEALVEYDVNFSQNFTRPPGTNCPPHEDMQAYASDLGSRVAAQVAATGDRIAEMVPTGCMPLGTDRALVSGIMVVVGPVGAGARATAALKQVSSPTALAAAGAFAFGGSQVGFSPEDPADTGETVKIPDFLSFLGAGFDASQYYPYPSMDASSQALNPKQWLRSEPIVDRKSLGSVGYTTSNVEICQVKADLRTAKSAQEAKEVLGISAKVSASWFVTASVSAEYNKAVESTASSETMMATSSIDCTVASYELKSVANYKPAAMLATEIMRIVDWNEKRKDALASGDTGRAETLRKRMESALGLFLNNYGTSFVTRFNLGAFMYMTMQFEGSAMATRVEESKSLEADLSTTFASVSGKISTEGARATSLENQAMNSRITASPLAALPTFKPAGGAGDDAKQYIVDVQAWQADINAARKDPIGINKDVDETNNQFYPFPDVKTHKFFWEWLEETLVYFDETGANFWEEAIGGDYEAVVERFAEIYKDYIYRVTDAAKLSKLNACFPSPLVVKNPKTGACDSCLDSSLFGAQRGYCNPRGTAACFWNAGDNRPGCACAPPCYGVNPVSKLRDCYNEGGRMHHPWARDDSCPGRPNDIPFKSAEAMFYPPLPTQCNMRYTSDGSPLSDLLRDRVWCSKPNKGDCETRRCSAATNPPVNPDRFCWKPPAQEAFSGLQYVHGQELAPNVYTVLATGCNKKGKCDFPVERFLRQYAGNTHGCVFYSVRNQVNDCTHEVDAKTGEVKDSLRDPVAKPYFVDLPGPPPGQGTVVWSRVPPSKCLAQIVVPPGGNDADLRSWVCRAGEYPALGEAMPSQWDGVSFLEGDFGKLCPRM